MTAGDSTAICSGSCNQKTCCGFVVELVNVEFPSAPKGLLASRRQLDSGSEARSGNGGGQQAEINPASWPIIDQRAAEQDDDSERHRSYAGIDIGNAALSGFTLRTWMSANVVLPTSTRPPRRWAKDFLIRDSEIYVRCSV